MSGSACKSEELEKVPAVCYLAITKAVTDGLKPHSEKIEKMHDRMFIDNGKLSVQTMLTRHATQLFFQWAILSVIMISLLGLFISSVVQATQNTGSRVEIIKDK